jgi:hypothetical protein
MRCLLAPGDAGALQGFIRGMKPGSVGEELGEQAFERVEPREDRAKRQSGHDHHGRDEGQSQGEA